MNTIDKVISFRLAKKIWEVAKKKRIELPESEWWWEQYPNSWGEGWELVKELVKKEDAYIIGQLEKLEQKYKEEKQYYGNKVKEVFDLDYLVDLRKQKKRLVGKRLFPAYDVAELLEMLPGYIDNFPLILWKGDRDRLTDIWESKKIKIEFWCGYLCFDKDRGQPVFNTPTIVGDTPPQALGKLFLYLLENDLWGRKEEK